MRSALAVAVTVGGLGACLAGPVLAADVGYAPRVAAYEVDASRRVDLGLGKSFLVELPRDAKEVFVADPKIANAVVRSARQAYLIGSAVGQTSMLFLDADGRQILALDVNVGRDTRTIQGTIQRALGRGQVTVQAVGDGLVLAGSVPSAADASTAMNIAAGYVGDIKKVVNSLAIEGNEQVMLKVTVAEVERRVVKQLGVDFQASAWNVGDAILGPKGKAFEMSNPFPLGVDPSSTYSVGWTSDGGSLTATIRALDQNRVLRTLAEPTMTAISGESATFLAGGEVPIPTGYSCQNGICSPSLTFKKIGVQLAFTPVVLSAGRISLKIRTEVSDIARENSFQYPIGRQLFTIPGFRTRSGDSTVELPSGGSIVMAGLIQQQSQQALSGVPGMMNLPVLGSLFKSRDYQHNDTELVIIVTPYLAKPVAAAALARPDDGFADPSDPSTVLLGRLNRLYGVPGKIDPTSYPGRYGFILD